MKNEYSYLFTGYIMSYLSDHDIIKWADNKILRDEYDSVIVDLSLANSKNSIITALGKLCKEDQTFGETGTGYLSLYQRICTQKLLHWSVIGKEICKLCSNGFWVPSSPDEECFLIRLNDYFGLINDGLAGNMRMPEELTLFLSAYQEDIQPFKELGFKVKGIEVCSL